VWKLERPEDEFLIAPALEKLYDKTTSGEYLDKWTAKILITIRNIQISKPHLSPPGGTPESIEFNAASDLHFFELCLDNDHIQALLKLILLSFDDSKRVKPWMAQAWLQLIFLADEYEKVMKILEDLVHLCKDVLLNSFNSEIACLRLFASDIKLVLTMYMPMNKICLKKIRLNELSGYFDIIMQRLPNKIDPSQVPLNEAAKKITFLVESKPSDRDHGLTGIIMDFPPTSSLPIMWCAPEYTLGPILLLRLIRRVYQTYGSDMFSWTSLPPNTLPKEQLGQIQQILSPSVLQLLRNTVTKRILISKNTTTNSFKSNQICEDSEDLRGLYLAAAELALQVVQLYQDLGHGDSEELFLATQKDFVTSLSNVSLMCRRSTDWYYSWWFAKATNEAVKRIYADIDTKDIGWDPQAILQKNQDRLLDAERRLMEIRRGK
ncbi:hypothetical protein M422DRAFT_262276, partial [Sphaerobolus stellatus SS14]